MLKPTSSVKPAVTGANYFVHPTLNAGLLCAANEDRRGWSGPCKQTAAAEK